MFSYKVYKCFNDELESLWNDLLNKSNHTVYQTFGINKIWYNTIGRRSKNIDLSIFVFFDSARIVAIAPMLIKTKFKFISQLNFLGEGIFDYQMIVNENNIKNNLNDFIFNSIKSNSKIDLIFMSNVPGFLKENSIDYKLHMKLNRVNKILMLELPDSYEIFFDKLKSSIRGDSKRQIKKIKKFGDSKYKIINQDDKFFIDKLISFKRIRYKNTNVYDIFNIPGYFDFFQDMFKSKNFKFTHCSTLNIGNEPISFHLGFVYQNKYYYYFPSFNQEKWGKYSPSRLHMLNLIEEAISNKINVFDFTIGNEKYKKYFANMSSETYNYELGVSVLGKLYLVTLKLLNVFKTVFFKIKFLKYILLKIK